MSEVLFVVVSYHGAADVEGLVASLRAGTDDHWRMVIVDNSDDPRENDRLRRCCDAGGRVVLLTAEGNLGYLGGARYALQHEGGRPHAWVVVSNADILYAPDFVALLNSTNPTAVLAPAIVSDVSGIDQNPFMVSRPGRWTLLRWRVQAASVSSIRLVVAVGHIVALLRRPFRRRQPDVVATTSRQIYAAHGSCLVLPGPYFGEPDSLLHSAFLFGEEITIAERARHLGVPVIHRTDLRVRHAEHRSTGWWRSRQVSTWQRDSVREIAKRLHAGQLGLADSRAPGADR